MVTPPYPGPPSPSQPTGTAPVVTHRATPPGVLPRRAQVWLMVAVAGGIVAIILFTGHEPAPPRAVPGPARATLAPNPEQLRSYQQRLEAADTRPRSVAPPLAPAPPELRPIPPTERVGAEPRAARPQDALAEERRRRDYDSLFASNVVHSVNPTLATESPRPTSRRQTDGAVPEMPAGPPSLDDVAAAVVRASASGRTGESVAALAASGASPTPPATVSAAAQTPTAPAPPETTAADGPLHRILEGTVIETVLTNRLDGTTAAPVNCLVSSPIYAGDGQQVVIPAGSRILGSTKPVQAFGDTRLAVAFTRLVLPNGRTYALDHFLGLNEIGDAGLRDQVNQHYRSTFGASAAVGLISGLGQFLSSGFGTRTSGPVIITGSVSDTTAQATSQTMGRFLNRLPSITIREGHRVKVYLTSDLHLPLYQAFQPRRDSGPRLPREIQP